MAPWVQHALSAAAGAVGGALWSAWRQRRRAAALAALQGKAKRRRRFRWKSWDQDISVLPPTMFGGLAAAGVLVTLTGMVAAPVTSWWMATVPRPESVALLLLFLALGAPFWVAIYRKGLREE